MDVQLELLILDLWVHSMEARVRCQLLYDGPFLDGRCYVYHRFWDFFQADNDPADKPACSALASAAFESLRLGDLYYV